MTFEIRDDTQIAGIWFMDAGAANGFDWLAHVYKQGPEGLWEFKYRFRYHEPDDRKDPFNNNDRKTWMSGEAHGGTDEDRQKLIDMMREVSRKLTEVADGRLDEVLDVGTGVEALMAALKDKPWCHMQSAVNLGGNNKVVEA